MENLELDNLKGRVAELTRELARNTLPSAQDDTDKLIKAHMLANFQPGKYGSSELTIPNAQVGLIIGKSGRVLKSLKEKHNTLITIQSNRNGECSKTFS